MAVGSQNELTTTTLNALEHRLRRLEGLITGDTNAVTTTISSSRNETVTKRLERLEHGLERLSSSSKPVAELLQLYKTYPDLFPPRFPVPPSSSFTTREQLATVNACATTFSTTASQLTSIQDSPIPSAESSTNLIALQPRLVAAGQEQAHQARQLSELRLRSARLLQRWYETSVMGENECWAEWDERLTNAEIQVRREEAKRESEEGAV